MNFDSDDRLIAGALSDMEEQMPEVDLLPGVYAKLSAHRKRRPLRMALAAAIAAALLITGCAAALGGLDWIGEMMNGLGFTDVVEPVDYSVTDEGIEFGVLGARRYGSAAVFYVTARDTLGRGRTAEDADGMSHLVWASGSTVNASFSVDGYSQHFVRLVSYDEETQTAAYEITAVFEDMPVPDELTVRLRGYNISYENISELPIEIDVGAAASGEHLTEGAELLAFRRGGAVPDTGLSFGALGAIGGKLTVQLWYSIGGEFTVYWPLPADIYLLDGAGDRYELADSRWQQLDSGEVVHQFTFDAAPEELSGATMYFSGSAERRLTGDWGVTVPLTDGEDQRQLSVDIDLGDTVIEDAELTLCPVGFTLSGTAPRATLERLAGMDAYIVSDGRVYGTIADSASYYDNLDEQDFSWFYLYYSTYAPDSVTELRFGRDVSVELG